MRNMSEIKRNIRAVEETKQITNAMFLLSTSRMKRSLLQIGHNQLYMRRIRATLKDLLQKTPELDHPYLQPREEKSPAFLVIASDKGLCGSYNNQVMHLALEKIQQYENPHICAVGQHAVEYLSNHGYQPDVEFTGASQRPDVYYSRAIAEHFVRFYDEGMIDSLYVVYTHYLSQMKQTPSVLRLLPAIADDFEDVNTEIEYAADLLYEPAPKAVFGHIIPQYLVGMVYDCLNQAACAEHVSRMNAMQSATKNAEEMLTKLNLQYNSARQLAITSEITEIAAATEVAQHAV